MTHAIADLAARLSRDDAAVLAAGLLVGLSAVFLLFPGVDMAVSGLFYRPDAGFFLAADPLFRALRRSSTIVMTLMLAVPLARWAWRAGRRQAVDRSARQALFLIAALIVGPGLMINGLLKAVWGRARPVEIEAFGGDAAFTAAWVPSQACASNCSFVSGEGAAAAWMVAAALVLTPSPLRPWVVPGVALYAVSLSFNRIAFGGHFLSDIVLSWVLTALVIVVLHRVFYGAPAAAPARSRGPARPVVTAA